jgi:hypothetical protein
MRARTAALRNLTVIGASNPVGQSAPALGTCRNSEQAFSIQTQLLLYSLTPVVPALVFGVLVIVLFARRRHRWRAREHNHNTQGAILFAVARRRRSFYGQAMAAQEVGGDHFFLAAPSGRQALDTRVACGAPLLGVSGNDWRDLIEARRPRVSDRASAGSSSRSWRRAL